MTQNFWWKNSKDTGGIYWQRWKDLCRTKKAGGLGFRDPHCFNLALLAKKCWRILKNPTSLVARVLKAKYYPDHSFLKARKVGRSSLVWRSLLAGRKLLNRGLLYCIGDGQSVSIWEDYWIPSTNSRRPLINRATLSGLSSVSNLIDPTTRQWRCHLILSGFSRMNNKLFWRSHCVHFPIRIN